MIHKENAKIISNEKVAKSIFVASLSAPEIARDASPGQFIELAPLAPHSILNRPMAIYDANPKTGEIKIGFHAVGANTREYAKLKKGDSLTLFGSMGKKHDFDLSYDTYILVSGGIGITSIHLIGKHLKENNKKIITLIGSRSKDHVACKNDFEKLGETHVATDDGSEGHHGYVHELLEQTVRAYRNTPLQIIYCGPHPMMKACAGVCNEQNIPHLAIMEEMMACGFGICAACVCQTIEGKKKVCIDGPVFDGAKITWDTE